MKRNARARPPAIIRALNQTLRYTVSTHFLSSAISFFLIRDGKIDLYLRESFLAMRVSKAILCNISQESFLRI